MSNVMEKMSIRFGNEEAATKSWQKQGQWSLGDIIETKVIEKTMRNKRWIWLSVDYTSQKFAFQGKEGQINRIEKSCLVLMRAT